MKFFTSQTLCKQQIIGLLQKRNLSKLLRNFIVVTYGASLPLLFIRMAFLQSLNFVVFKV